MSLQPMKRRKTSAILSVVALTLLAPKAFSQGSAGADEMRLDQTTAWRFQLANDLFLDSDNQFTNGISVQKHSSLFPALEDTTGTPAFGKRLANLFLPNTEGLYYREAWAFGQNIQTPEDIGREDLIRDDIPYAGMIAWANSFVAFDDRDFTGFELLVGWMGSGSLAEETHEAVHDLLGADEPNGWDNQLDDEPILNFYFMKKHKLWRRPHFDGAINFDAALGNFFTFGQGSLDMRFGRMPDGFTFVPTPIGRGMDYDATIRTEGQIYTYGSLVIRGTGFVSALPREGNNFGSDNLWTSTNTVELERLVGQVILGFHVERGRWGIHLNLWISTDTLKTTTVSEREDPGNDFGTIMFERRF